MSHAIVQPHLRVPGLWCRKLLIIETFARDNRSLPAFTASRSMISRQPVHKLVCPIFID